MFFGEGKKQNWRLILGLVAFRLLNAVLVQTHFDPDETWQSAEVAHGRVFGSVSLKGWKRKGKKEKEKKKC
jgi:hypothetical protein